MLRMYLVYRTETIPEVKALRFSEDPPEKTVQAVRAKTFVASDDTADACDIAYINSYPQRGRKRSDWHEMESRLLVVVRASCDVR